MSEWVELEGGDTIEEITNKTGNTAHVLRRVISITPYERITCLYQDVIVDGRPVRILVPFVFVSEVDVRILNTSSIVITHKWKMNHLTGTVTERKEVKKIGKWYLCASYNIDSPPPV